MKERPLWEHFDQVPIVGILRNVAVHQVEELAKHYSEAGLTTLEVTMNSEQAEKAISSLAQEFGQKLNIGAGTVCSVDDLHKALNAGAQFIVTPIVNQDVIKECVSREIPVFAGAYTPTEIYTAWSSGASMVKVFPSVSAKYIKEVLAPLNSIRMMPTGGITVDNFTDFLEAGAKGVGIGSGLIKKDLIESENWDEFKKLASQFVKRYNDFTKNITR